MCTLMWACWFWKHVRVHLMRSLRLSAQASPGSAHPAAQESGGQRGATSNKSETTHSFGRCKLGHMSPVLYAEKSSGGWWKERARGGHYQAFPYSNRRLSLSLTFMPEWERKCFLCCSVYSVIKEQSNSTLAESSWVFGPLQLSLLPFCKSTCLYLSCYFLLPLHRGIERVEG